VTGKNKHPFLGWHPPTELGVWARAEADRRGVSLSVILTEALSNLRALSDTPRDTRDPKENDR
jgi:hypothetical protein